MPGQDKDSPKGEPRRTRPREDRNPKADEPEAGRWLTVGGRRHLRQAIDRPAAASVLPEKLLRTVRGREGVDRWAVAGRDCGLGQPIKASRPAENFRQEARR